MSIRLDHLSFAFPDSTAPVLREITTTFSARRTGVVGRNGSGKTTLLRLITGQLSPTSGTITADGDVGYLPQDVVRHDDRRILDLLGVGHVVDALARIEAGSVEQTDFDAVGEDWDVVERAQALLAQHVPSLGSPADLNRTTTTLSGGEILQVAMIGLLLRGHRDAVLDEPTNNLDARSRERFYGLVAQWPGCLVVVSHDVELLNQMDEIAEVRDGDLRVFTGNYDVYVEAIGREQEAVRRDIRDAERTLRREKAERLAAQERISHEERTGRRQRDERKHTAKMVGELASRMQQRHGAERQALYAAQEQAQETLDAAERRLRDDDNVMIDLPDPAVNRSRDLAVFHHTGIDGNGAMIHMRGRERIAIIGDNGVGKTTLLRTLLGDQRRMIAWAEPKTDRIGYLSQKIDDLPEEQSVLDVLRAVAPSLTPGELRNRLARFLIRREDVHRPIATLSGGERFRVALARLLLAEPAHQLLLLDEPTNHLDIDTVGQLVHALGSYRGGIVLASHDRHFLHQLELTRIVELTSDGQLVDLDLNSSDLLTSNAGHRQTRLHHGADGSSEEAAESR